MRPVQGPRLRASVRGDLAAGSVAELERTGQGERIALEGADLTGVDLSGGRLTECMFRGVSLLDADLTAGSVIESSWERVSAPHLKAPRSTWRDVVIDDSRFGVAEVSGVRVLTIHSGPQSS